MQNDSPLLYNANHFFDERLKEINDEMQTILDRTKLKQQRFSDRWTPPKATDKPVRTPPSAFHCGAATPLPYLLTEGHAASSSDGLSAQQLEAAIARACQTEVARWMESNFRTYVDPLVESQTAQQVEAIHRGLQDLRFSHREVLNIISEIRSECESQRHELKSAVYRVERQAVQSRQEVCYDIDGKVKDLHDLLAGVESSVKEFRGSLGIEIQRVDKRVGESELQQEERRRQTVLHLQEKVYGWKEELSERVQRHIEQIRDNQSCLDHHLAQLQGMLDSTTESSHRHASDIKMILEESIERRSDVRRCQRDVNRLEMLLQCYAPQGAAHSISQSENPCSAERAPLMLLEEVLHIKEGVSSLIGRVNALEARQNRMEELLNKLCVGDRFGGAVELHSSGEDTIRKKQENFRTSTTGSPLDLLPMLGAHKTETGDTLKPQRGRSGTEANYDNKSISSRGKLSEEESAPPQDPNRTASSERAAPFSQSSRHPTNNSVLSPSTIQAAGTSLRSHNSLRFSEAAPRHSSDEEPKEPEDSYVSMTTEPPHHPGGGGGGQGSSGKTSTSGKAETYAPPPTSDSESDRDNHHLTRLALD